MKTSIFSTVRSFAAFFVAGLAFAACSSDNSLVEEPQPVQQPSQSGSVYTVTVNATKGGETRALSVDGSDISATWSVGDEVTVYNVTEEIELSGTLVAQSDGTSTTLTGDLSGYIDDGNVLKLMFLSPDYATQDGTLEYIATHCDYAEATVKVSDISGSSIVTTDAAFENKQAIVKFTLKDKANDAALSASAFSVNAGSNTCIVTPASATSELYVAIPAIYSQTVSLAATVGDDTYIYDKDGITFEAGKYYPIAVKMTEYDINDAPLTFEAKTAGAEVTFTATTGGITPIEYNKYDGLGWQTYESESPVTLTNVGDKVSFRGTNATYSDGYDYSTFSCSDECYIYGNIMSLIDKSGYATNTTLTGTHTFYKMFYYNSNICNHPVKSLTLPATTLMDYCYYQMFYGCSKLTAAPALPATTLSDFCYYSMFSHCTKLTAAPVLPSTLLAESCYQYMFENCIITEAPALPATELAESCYHGMFSGCIKLTAAPALPATTLATKCYRAMFSGCTSLTTTPELPATTLASDCYESMFSYCSKLTAAPELPATTLTAGCYQYMFENCTKLTAAPALPATMLSDYCYYFMFRGCTSLTTAPELRATSLANYCYAYMFSVCTSLTEAPELPATSLAWACYNSMFSNCSKLEEAPELPATSLSPSCYASMFLGCTSLTTAPALPAARLTNNCYEHMFRNCSNLANIKCLASEGMSATNCTNGWVYGVAATGTFTKATGADWSGKTGANGIPSGWTVLEE